MAAVMTLMAKENGFTPTIDFQLLLYPVTNADFDTETYRQFADGPWLTKQAWSGFGNNICRIRRNVKAKKRLR